MTLMAVKSNTNRNLYVNSVSYDGGNYGGTSLYSNGVVTLQASGPSNVTSSSDTLTVHLSEDAYQGNADFKLIIDNKISTTQQPVTALHNVGALQDFAFAGNFGYSETIVSIVFTNDAYGGSSSTDRNLYVNGIDVNGVHSGNGVSALLSTGSSAIYKITTTAQTEIIMETLWRTSIFKAFQRSQNYSHMIWLMVWCI